MLDYVTIHGDNGATSRWRFSGASRSNSDDGRLYVALTQNMGDTTVSVYRDVARSHLVAQGTLAGVTGNAALAAQNASGLSGSVELLNAAPSEIELDVFYACGDDLAAGQGEIGRFLNAGLFAGEQGFSAPCAWAKRMLDALLASRGYRGKRFDSLTPLCEPALHYALAFIYENLTQKEREPAEWQANRHRALARSALMAVELAIDGQCFFPFTTRVTRA